MNLMRIYIKSYFQRNNHPYSSIFPTLEFPPANSNSREQARSIKYAADGVTIPPRRYMTYLDAALAFAQCGFEMACEHVRPQDDVSQMYEDTIKMLRSVFSRYKHTDPSDSEKKLYVLNLRIQALLCQKLFKFKRAEASRYSKILASEHYSKTPTVTPAAGSAKFIGSSPSAAASSPYPAASSAGAPSPAGSSHGGSAAADATVAVPVRIHAYNQRYKAAMDLVLNSHELWETADEHAHLLKDFFSPVESKCGSVHLSCTIPDLARYVKECLKALGHDHQS